MKNLYAAFLCIIGVVFALTQSQAKDLSGSSDTASISSIAHSFNQASPYEDSPAIKRISQSPVYFFAFPFNDNLTHVTITNRLSNLDTTTSNENLTYIGKRTGLGNFLGPPPNDNFASAIDVTALINAACVTTGVYTNVGATGDQAKPSCWLSGPTNNVWFKFKAPASGFLNVQVSVGAASETLRWPHVAIFDASLVEVACQISGGNTTSSC